MASESQDLLLEVFAQVAQGQVVELLEFGLVGQRLDKGLAKPLFEVTADKRTDAVFLCGLLGVALRVLERVFEVVLRCDGLTCFILELEREVAQDPVEGREVALDELFVVDVGVFKLDVFRQIQDEVEILDGRLVDRASRVVYEATGEEQSEREDFVVVVAVLVECAESFGVHDNHVDFLVV